MDTSMDTWRPASSPGGHNMDSRSRSPGGRQAGPSATQQHFPSRGVPPGSSGAGGSGSADLLFPQGPQGLGLICASAFAQRTLTRSHPGPGGLPRRGNGVFATPANTGGPTRARSAHSPLWFAAARRLRPAGCGTFPPRRPGSAVRGGHACSTQGSSEAFRGATRLRARSRRYVPSRGALRRLAARHGWRSAAASVSGGAARDRVDIVPPPSRRGARRPPGTALRVRR